MVAVQGLVQEVADDGAGAPWSAPGLDFGALGSGLGCAVAGGVAGVLGGVVGGSVVGGVTGGLTGGVVGGVTGGVGCSGFGSGCFASLSRPWSCLS